MSKNNLLKTAEFAKMCKTTRETLKWYDETGILKPVLRGENGYRYYSLEQVMAFDLISSMKNLGCSLDEIKKLQRSKNIQTYQTTIQNKYAVIEQRIAQITRQLRLIESLDKCITEAVECKENQPELVFLEEEYLYTTPYDSIGGYTSINKHIVDSMSVENVVPHPNGLIISGDALQHQKTKIKAFFYVMVPNGTVPPAVRKAGEYVQLYQHGDIETLHKVLPIMEQFISENHLVINGDILLYDLVTNLLHGSKEDYVSKVLIPVRHS